MSAAPPPPWYKNSCITGAIGNGLLHVGIDAIGLIPEGGVVAKMAGKLVFSGGYRGIVATQQAGKIIGAVKAGTGIISTGLNSDDTSKIGVAQTVAGVAGLIPGIGQAAAGASIVLDFIHTGIDISKCH